MMKGTKRKSSAHTNTGLLLLQSRFNFNYCSPKTKEQGKKGHVNMFVVIRDRGKMNDVDAGGRQKLTGFMQN